VKKKRDIEKERREGSKKESIQKIKAHKRKES
jgi:hypothetical protein